MDLRLAARSRSIDLTLLGERLKLARVAAGLTQSQVAGTDISAAYVSRIEAGQRRPEALLLERMATRLGVLVEDLLADVPATPANTELRVRLDHAELALLSGNAENALGVLAELREDPAFQSTDLARRRKQIEAGALEALGRSDEAVRLLEELVDDPSADAEWVKSVIALSRCLREAGEFGNAISVGERALPMLAELELEGTTEGIQLSVTIAAAYVERGDLSHALAICQRCIDAAEQVRLPVAKASAYWNASVIESLRGNAESALSLAQRAIALFEEGEDSRNLGRLRTEVAYIHLLQTPPDATAARAVLVQAERELDWSSASQVDRARAKLMRGRTELHLAAPDAAETFARSAIELLGDESPTLLAESQALVGQARAAHGDMAEARDWYRRAIEVLTSVGIDRDVARQWFDLASMLEAAGDPVAALDAYKRGAAATGLADAQRMSQDAARA